MNRRDPTADRAIGAVNREWSRMVALAMRVRRNPMYLTPEVEQEFTGIYRRLLTDPMEELLRETPKGRQT